MKLIFIFAIWLFVVYGAEGCVLMDMAARTIGSAARTIGSVLAPQRANPNVLVINTRRREPQPRPVVVHHTLYTPPRIDYRIHGGIAVARPKESPKVDIRGALGKLLSPPQAIAVARPTESPKIDIDILGALGKLLSLPQAIAVARTTESPKIDIDILGALGRLLSLPKSNDYGRGEVRGRIPRPRRPKPIFDNRFGPPRRNNYGREEKPGGIVLSGVTNNQNINA